MSKERNHYYILGLQPGASPGEIKSAFRRLVKLYHPDQDQSLYAEMRYREIQAAYEALKNAPEARTGTTSHGYSPQPNASYGAAGSRHSTRHSTTQNHETVCGKNWSYTEDHESQHFDFSDLMQDYVRNGKERLKKRLPFSLENLPDIFTTSFKEVFGIGMTFRVILATLGFWSTLTWAGLGSILSVGVILCVFLGALLYRYCFSSYRTLLPANIVGSVLLSVVLGFLCTTATNQTYLVFRGTARSGPIEGAVLGFLFTPRVEQVVRESRIIHGATLSTRTQYHYFDGSGPIFAYIAGMMFICLFLLWARPLKWFLDTAQDDAR